MKGVKHYTKDGKEFKGATHKMDDGSLHTGKTHTKTSQILVHKSDLKKQKGGVKTSTVAMSSDTIQGLSSSQNAAKLRFERNIQNAGLNPFSRSVKSNTTVSKDSDGNFIYRYITPTEKKHGGVHSDSKDFMKRMGYYQGGGLSQTPMYGANTMPGTPETAQLTYQEADQAKLDALDEQLKEQQESTEFMDEAKANTDAQAAKISSVEQGLGQGIKGLDKVGVFDKLKAKGAEKVADKLKQEALAKGTTLAGGVSDDALKALAPKLFEKSITPGIQSATSSLPSSLANFSVPSLTTTPLSQLGTTASTSLVNPALGQQGANLLNAGATAGASASKGLIGGIGTGGVGAIASLAGEGIKMASDDQDATTMNTGETIGSGLSGIGTGIGAAMTTAALMGSTLGPIGTAAGVIGGAAYGLGKGLIQRGKARREEGKAEKKQEVALNKIKTKQKVEGLKDREYSGYDMGQNLAMYGGMKQYQAGGVALPGGTMEPIPGTDAVEFKGQSHDEGGIMLDPQTEVEGNETMDQVTMAKKGGKRDYFFSQHLKMGGKSFAQRHKDILKNGGSQKDIDKLAKMQETKAGRDPNAVQLGAGGYKTFQLGGNIPVPPAVVADFYGNPTPAPMPQNNTLTQQGPSHFENQNITVDALSNQIQQSKDIMSGKLVFDAATNSFIPVEESTNNNETKEETKPTTTTSNKKTREKELEPIPSKGPGVITEFNPLQPFQGFPTNENFLTKDSDGDGVPDYVDFVDNPPYDGPLSDQDKKAISENNETNENNNNEKSSRLRKLYNKLNGSKKGSQDYLTTMAQIGQLIPAATAYMSKPDYMSDPGSVKNIKSQRLDRVSYNQERSQNAADNRAMGKFIEQSGLGPAGIIAKMSSYRAKQTGDMKIAAQESRINTEISNQEAQFAQQADMANQQMALQNIKNSMYTDEFNRAADAAVEDKKLMALDNAFKSMGTMNTDRLKYDAQERLGDAISGQTGVLTREQLGQIIKDSYGLEVGSPAHTKKLNESYLTMLNANKDKQAAMYGGVKKYI